MTVDEVVQVLNASLPNRLSQLQEMVLRYAWEGKTYSSMAREAHYGAEHLRKVASQLWLLLSEFWGEPIGKANFRSYMESRHLTAAERQLIEPLHHSQTPEFPSGPVGLNSNFYIPRPPIEELACDQIAEPGSIIRLKAPRRMGKSSLILRILARSRQMEYYTVSLDFQQADRAVFTSLDKLLRWFSAYVSRELNLKSKLDDYWDEEIGSKVSCTLYFQQYLLEQISSPIVMVLNEVNRVFEYPEAQDFLAMLRFWHEQAKQVEIWQKLRIVIVYSTEIYISLKLNQSPFNVGLFLKLPPFNLEQVQNLALRHGFDWTDGDEANKLMELVGGHPYLVRLALYHLWRGDVKLVQLLQEATTADGIYHEFLQQQLEIIQAEPELVATIERLLAAGENLNLDPHIAHQLYSMGLLDLDENGVNFSCELYRAYFSRQLPAKNRIAPCIQYFEKENKLPERTDLDSLTGLVNRSHFDDLLQQQWQQLARVEKPLSLILCDIDFFKLFNEARGVKAGDDCLRQIASTLRECAKDSADLVTRYGDEEFAVVLPERDLGDALSIAREIQTKIKALAIRHDPERVIGFSPFVTLSIGIANTIPNWQNDSATLMRAAKAALSQSKTKGRDRISIST